jgi:hypothetical protein
MSAPLNDATVVHHEDLVGGANRRQPMGHDEGSATRQRRVQGILDVALGL